MLHAAMFWPEYYHAALQILTRVPHLGAQKSNAAAMATMQRTHRRAHRLPLCTSGHFVAYATIAHSFDIEMLALRNQAQVQSMQHAHR